jgi:ADP-ribose pyrophosphatase
VLLIRQFRHAADDFIWEVPAGRLDPGETPEVCAARELEEEAGMVAGRIDRLTTIYTTPGFTDERIHLFLADRLTEGVTARDEDEFIEPVRLRLSDALRRVESGEISDAKTICTLLHAAVFRLRR